jgi:hypothetical protein
VTEAPMQLEYSAKPPRVWRVMRRAGLVVILLSLAGIVWRWGGPLYDRARLMYWERRCMNYTAPRGSVVYDENPATVVASSRGTDMLQRKNPAGAVEMTFVNPKCYNQYLPELAAIEPSMRKCYADAPVFMHTLKGPNGPRLVIIGVTYPVRQERLRGHSSFYLDEIFQAQIIKPTGWRSDPVPSGIAWAPRRELAAPSEVGKLRFYAGQTDPADASHVTIDCDTAGGRRTIDVRLMMLQGQEWLDIQLRPLPRKDE